MKQEEFIEIAGGTFKNNEYYDAWGKKTNTKIFGHSLKVIINM